MWVSAYKQHNPGTGEIPSFITLESTVDKETLMGILSRDLVLCNRIDDGSIIIKSPATGISKAIIPIESASHPESDYGFGNVLFDIAMMENR